MKVLIFVFVIFEISNGLSNDGFLGCYRIESETLSFYSKNFSSNECRQTCLSSYYVYALISSEETCFCSNYLRSEFNARSCADVCPLCPEKKDLMDIYFTGATIPGPPQNIKIANVTDTGVYISWKEPKSYINIDYYEITLKVLHTFSGITAINPKWRFSNNTFNTELDFQPGTKYNITVKAATDNGQGNLAYKIVETTIGQPDNIPSPPIILERKNTTVTVQINSVINNNGPITAYRLVVINEDLNQIIQTDNLKSYNEAVVEGLDYYITAEIKSENVVNNFIVGDGRYYGPYFNAPLKSDVNYRILLGIVSSYNNITKIVYSNDTKPIMGSATVNILSVPKDEENIPGVIIGLSIAIGLLSVVLIAGIIGFFILTKKISNRRRRLTNNQELIMQGPIIEVENSAYIPEEEIIPTNHYENLKQQLWSIPQTSIKIEPTNLLGIGKFGRVNSGTVRKDSNIIPTAIYTIPDRKLGQENKYSVLKDLDLLIRIGKHENVLKLLGISENADTLFVVLEYASMNLKDLLLGSRDALPGRFSNMQETQALNICHDIANGMMHLESLKIVHKQLCARNILITNGYIPKISGYGLAQYCNPNMVPDYTRWTAAEVFRSQKYISKCDIWSFACLLWEICVLGGTPYGSVPNNEIPDRVMRGLRLTQVKYISDELYQLMLNCWQLDLDERPTFVDLVYVLSIIKGNQSNDLNFDLYSEFQYEEFYPNMELAARTIH